jgi:hypothetical protein
VLRQQEPFKCHLTITVTDKFRDLHPEMNTGSKGKVPTGTGQALRAVKLQTLLSLADSRHHGNLSLFPIPKKEMPRVSLV